MVIRYTETAAGGDCQCSFSASTRLLLYVLEQWDLSYWHPQVKMTSLNDEVLAEAEGEMLYWDQVYRR